ncbi:MAG: EAL domain-containing protein [Desertifilum sp. SIO1I2]|nr:EAL domain-containing protein [Desertifilum sp. SIO1I2]
MVRRKSPPSNFKTLNRENLLNRITTRIRQSLELQEILDTTAREIRSFLEMDRVKIYRFLPDGNGEVIAESIVNGALPSLLGLCFPASDIPAHTREMFIKVRQRVIVDVVSAQKTLHQLDNPNTGDSLAIEDVRYAPVDPCHIEYLTAMGVCSSLVVPILHHNQLWGLLACHHRTPKTHSETDLKIVQLLVDQVSIAIAQADLLARARQQAEDEAKVNQVSYLLHAPMESTEIRQTVLEEVVKVLEGCGGRLYITADPTGQPAQIYTYGSQPRLEASCLLEETNLWQRIIGSWNPMSDWKALLSYANASRVSQENSTASGFSRSLLFPDVADDFDLGVPAGPYCSLTHPSTLHHHLISHLHIIKDIYNEPQLESAVGAFQDTSIRSLLIVPLRYQQQCIGCISIFRPEIETETLWAGRQDRDCRNYRPRASFEAWRETIRGQAKPWTEDDIRLAVAIGIHLYLAVMQKRVEEMIRHQASHDLLTGLPNRVLFCDRLTLSLAQTQRYGQKLAVIFLDLDGFKTINDTLGHAEGDRLLKSVSSRLKHCLGPDDLVARWGGDEFTILVSAISSSEDAARIAQKILNTLSTPFQFEEDRTHQITSLHVKASLGIAIAPYDGEDVDTLLKNADAAMYRAKQQGRNNYQLYTSAIGTKILERLVLENNLYKALDGHEFLLHYQPQINLENGQIVGMEALLRWQSQELGGLVSPLQFIPLAEETGLISPIGEWVLRTACAQNRAWQLAGLPPLPIAVNLSARQFQNKNLVSTINQILKETGLESQYLEIEITESIAIQDMNFTIEVLHHLRNQNIQIAMDDFGTGYSSLGALKHLPINKLKIDRVFVRDLVIDSNDAAIIRAIVALGHGLKLKVIAEGVENLEQLQFLKSAKCDAMQGYLFSKPLSAEAATRLYQCQYAGKLGQNSVAFS